MHPAFYVFAGSTAVGLAAIILWKIAESRLEESRRSHGGCGQPPEFIARGTGADYRIVDEMLREVDARLRKICKLRGETEKRHAVRALLSHYNPDAFRGTDMEGNYRLIYEYIHRRLAGLHLSPA